MFHSGKVITVSPPRIENNVNMTTGYLRCEKPLKPSLVTDASQWFTKFIDLFAYITMSDVDLFSEMAAWCTAKSLTAYSSARDASRVGRPVDPDGSTQSVGI